MRRPVGAPPRNSHPGLGAGNTGMFAEQPVAPPGQPVDRTIAGNLVLSTVQGGEAAGDTTRRNMRSFAPPGMPSPQQFVRTPSSPNQETVLELAPLTLNTRRALSRNRGLAPGA